jgi:hypothetical protein
MRILITLAVQMNLTIGHMNVVTACLHGALNETVYMTQPEGFKLKGKEGYISLLHKALYNLKQASRAWHNKISTVLLSLAFKKSVNELCVSTGVGLGAEMCMWTEAVLLSCVHIIHSVKRIHMSKTHSSEITKSL